MEEKKKPMSMEEEEAQYRQMFGGHQAQIASSSASSKPMPDWNTDFDDGTAADDSEPEPEPVQRQQRSSAQRSQQARPKKKLPDWNTDVDESPLDSEPAPSRQRPKVQSREQQQTRPKKKTQEWNTDVDESPLDAEPAPSRQRPRVQSREQQQQRKPMSMEEEQEDFRRQQQQGSTRQPQQQQQRKPMSMEEEQEDFRRQQQQGSTRQQQQQQQQQQRKPMSMEEEEENFRRQQQQGSSRQPQQQQQQQQQSLASPRLPAAAAAAQPTTTNGIPDGAETATTEQISCDDCGKSFAPTTYEKLCKQYNNKGELKCVAMYCKKRKVFNSAKVRIQGNEHMDKDAQKMAIKARVEVVKDKKATDAGLKPKRKVKDEKWKKESETFRNAMRDNRLMEKAKKEGKPITYYLK